MLHIQRILLIFVITCSAITAADELPRERAWRLADQAREAARSGEYDQAVDLYSRALELTPESMPIRRDYATALGWMGRYQDASREFSTVASQEPDQPIWAVRELANAHFFGGNEAGALDGFDRLIAAGDRQESVLTRRGLTLLRMGRTAEAESQYREALGWYPDSQTAAVGLGKAFASLGRTEDAYTLAVTWGARAEPDAEIRLFAAEMLSALGRHEEAVAVYNRVSPERLREAGLADAAAAARRLTGDGPGRLALSPPAGTSTQDPTARAEALREEGVRAAREGDATGGIEKLEQSLRTRPEHIETMRDYAIVLGWSERYAEALAQFDRLMVEEPMQPGWARSELARNQLFGGRTASALETINGLIAEGMVDEATLSRKGLALRWLGRSEEAAATYRGLVKAYPESPQGVRGLVQALADGNRLADALDEAEEGLEKFPEDGELRIRQAQVLNWAGRHVQARHALEDLPPAFRETSDALQHRTLAARWASRPREAFELALEYRQKHPNDPRSERLLRELSYEYGTSVEVQADGVRDSNGYSYRSVLQRVTLPLSVSHRLGFLREKRNYEDKYAQPGEMSWNRYGVDWNGNLGRRVNAYGSLASLGYSQADTGRRWMGDASVSSLLTDQVVVAGGIGMIPAETLPALQERLIGWQTWGSARWRPTMKLEAGARYARRDFPDTTVRETAEFSGFYRLSQRGGHKVRLGGRSQWMWHDRWTPLFWSPQFFHTQLVSLHMEGSLPGRLDYVTEVGSGFQREAGYERQIPLVTTFELAKKLQPQLWLRVKAGYSNSSIDRINTGSGAYRFGYFSAGLDFRIGKSI